MHRRLQILTWLVVIALVATGCGGGDGDDGGAGDTTTTTTDAGPVDDSTTTTTLPDMTGDSGSTWCQRVREAVESDEPSPLSFNFFGLTTQQLQEQFERNLEVFEEWADLAPPEIEDAVDQFVDGFRTVVDIGNEANWDINVLANDAEFDSAFGEDIDAAGNAIDAYNRDVCGVELGFDSASGATSTTLPDEDDFVAQLFGTLTASLIPQEARDCLNEELADHFPGPLPAGYVPTQADFEAFDAAAQTCEVEGLGG